MRWIRTLVLVGIAAAGPALARAAAVWTLPADCTAINRPVSSSAERNACIMAIAAEISKAATFTRATLPAAGTAGRLALVTDGPHPGTVWVDDGTAWRPVGPFRGEYYASQFTSLQAAIDAIPNGSMLSVEPGTYSLNSTLRIRDRVQLHIRCLSDQRQAANGCTLRWNGPGGGTAILIDGTMDSTLEGFSLIPGENAFGVGIDIDTTAAARGLSTANQLKRVLVRVQNDAPNVGIRISHVATANNENMVLEDVTVLGARPTGNPYSSTGIEIGNSPNAMNHQFIRVGVGWQHYGIHQIYGSFHALQMSGTHNDIDIYQDGSAATSSIRGWDGEASWQFFVDAGYSNAPVTMIVEGIRWDGYPQAATGYKVIDIHGKGPFTLSASTFSSGGHYDPNLFLNLPATAIVSGSNFCNCAPFHQPGGLLFAHNNRCKDAASTVRYMPDLWGYPGIDTGGGDPSWSNASGMFHFASTSVYGDLQVKASRDPHAPNVSVGGTPGSTSYTYQVVGLTETGHTAASAAATITNGNATLSRANFNRIVIEPVIGIYAFDIYRTAGGPTQGKIGTVVLAQLRLAGSAQSAGGPVLDDSGLKADGTSPPTTNTTGALKIGSTTIQKHLSATASLDFAAWSGTDCQEKTIRALGAADGDTVVLGIPNALASVAGVTWSGWVSGIDAVTVRGCKITAGASFDPGAATVRVDVWHH
jgi:hypothetical protein